MANRSKRILCYGDSNTWGWVPAKNGTQRYDENSRWPKLLQSKLGDGYEVIEEGLGARTTMFDDPRPELPLRNGLKTLPIILESHLPLDLVILMLGTTDAKELFGFSADKISEGMQALIHAVKNFRTLSGTKPPQILVVVPPIVKEDTEFAAKLFKGATEKTTELVDKYKILTEQENVHYLNPNDDIQVDQSEGVHIDSKNHKTLAKLIHAKVVEIGL